MSSRDRVLNATDWWYDERTVQSEEAFDDLPLDTGERILNLAQNFPSQLRFPSDGDLDHFPDPCLDLHLRLVPSVDSEGVDAVPEGGEFPREESVAELLELVDDFAFSFGLSLLVVVVVVVGRESVAVDESVGEERFDEERVWTKGVVDDGEEDDLEGRGGLEEGRIELVKF